MKEVTKFLAHQKLNFKDKYFSMPISFTLKEVGCILFDFFFVQVKKTRMMFTYYPPMPKR
ncbi:hypothetical protein [Desulfonauticus submarinus]|uniref:hypothetical protein n=1 Tax=Desulfonauticus submarinus TaxID=206665 RepID=UPI000B8662B6|nr:hypothetical protein [Desulfonauticus submarinus]